MPDQTPAPEAQRDRPLREDEALPTASEEDVLEETARLAREGRKELESDPRERKGTPE
jgi:hypothetical protein